MQIVEFTIPVPPSLKNGKRLGRKFGSTRVSMRTSSAVLRAMREVQSLARFAAEDAEPGREGPLFDDDDVGVEMIHHARRGELTVRVWSEGSRPPKFAGRKRDLQNLQDGVLDALQGVLFANDNQVTKLTMQRRLD